MRCFAAVLLLSAFFAATAADVANLSGSWVLDTKRSRWGGLKQPPSNVVIEIEHSEPSLQYSGTLSRSGEDAPVKFEFRGAIDGKEYTSREDQAERKMTFRRISDRVIESVSPLKDGRTREHSTVTLSRDGKTIERRMQVREGDRVVREWTEIYEKRQ